MIVVAVPFAVFVAIIVLGAVLGFGDNVMRWFRGGRAPGGRKNDVWKRLDR